MRMRLRNAVILDGSGAPPFTGDLLVEDEYIAEVGEVSGPCDETLDLAGAALAPGFIDVHSHSDFTLPGDPEAQAKTLQGVTTEVVCNCGLGLMPANDQVSRFYDRLGPMIFGEPSGGCFRDLDAFRDALHERGVSVNVACLVPHGNVRCAVMGMAERSPSSVELDHMRSLVAEGMAQGAFGMSSGLVYPPGAYAGTEELAELAKELRTSTGEGIYTTHLRDEGAGLLAALDEAIRIGHEARVGVQIGGAYSRSSRTPLDASASMFGVSMSLPW